MDSESKRPEGAETWKAPDKAVDSKPEKERKSGDVYFSGGELLVYAGLTAGPAETAAHLSLELSNDEKYKLARALSGNKDKPRMEMGDIVYLGRGNKFGKVIGFTTEDPELAAGVPEELSEAELQQLVEERHPNIGV